MAYLAPLARSSLPELEPTFQLTEGFLGFLPNDVLTMAHLPQTTRLFLEFCVSLYTEATLPPELLHLVSMMASTSAGCRYCTAHTANKTAQTGVAVEKIKQLWNFETSPLFSPAERAALTLALLAAQSPSGVTAGTIDDAKQFYSEAEIVQLLFVICQFGFWNRWNDALATTLEDAPRAFSLSALPDTRWTAGKHS